MYASTSARAIEALPSYAVLRSWVHRPQAVAPCFVSDVHALQALREDMDGVSRSTRDVFLLNHFPCKFVELVGWVAGVDHRDNSMTITLDDGDGDFVLSVVVKLAQVEIPKKDKKDDKKEEKRSMFRSARERQLDGATKQAPHPFAPPPKMYTRPDIRVGDTVRVTGAVEEWTRRSDSVRQVVVDEASGGYIRIVDPDDQYIHVEDVNRRHAEVYSQPFSMPTVVSATASPTRPKPSPEVTFMSSMSVWDMSSEIDIDDEDKLADPRRLNPKSLTDNTFKMYAVDYMTRETRKAMWPAMRVLLADPTAQVPALAALFPEYADCTFPPLLRSLPSLRTATPSPSRVQQRTRSVRASPTPSRRSTSSTAPDIFAPSHAQNMSSTSCETPRRATFRSKAEREAAKLKSPHVDTDRTPTAGPRRSTFRSRAEREREREERHREAPPDSPSLNATPRAHVPAPSFPSFDASFNDSSFEPFTVTSLLADERLSTLAAMVIDRRARREENERRQRLKEGRPTRKDERVVADRRARGLRSSHWQLTDAERQSKMVRICEWAIRAAAEEGSIVQVDGTMHSLRTMETFDSCVSLETSDAGYVPLPPELLGPLLIPLAAAERANRRPTFRTRAEREAGIRRAKEGIDTPVLFARLRRWNERWERVGEHAVNSAVEWAEAASLLRLGE